VRPLRKELADVFTIGWIQISFAPASAYLDTVFSIAGAPQICVFAGQGLPLKEIFFAARRRKVEGIRSG
jgi:hypothetical protein